MGDDPILEQVKAIVTRIAGPTRAAARLDADTLLGEGGLWLDSLDLFEAILACEEGFGVQIEAEADATAEALRTVQGLADLIRATPRREPT